jgi:hypothetical protein
MAGQVTTFRSHYRTDRDARVSVKSRRVGVGRTATAWSFEPETTKADWLALVTINMDDRSRRIYLVPHEWAMKNSRHHKTTGNQRMLIANPDLERFRDNFALNANPAPSIS